MKATLNNWVLNKKGVDSVHKLLLENNTFYARCAKETQSHIAEAALNHVLYSCVAEVENNFCRGLPPYFEISAAESITQERTRFVIKDTYLDYIV